MMLNDSVRVIIPNKADYISLVRLISSALGSKAGFNIDEIDDLKVAIGEACILTFMPHSQDEIAITYDVSKEMLEVSIEGLGNLSTNEESKEAHLSKMIIESLMDEVHYLGDQLRMVKYID